VITLSIGEQCCACADRCAGRYETCLRRGQQFLFCCGDRRPGDADPFIRLFLFPQGGVPFLARVAGIRLQLAGLCLQVGGGLIGLCRSGCIGG
jgi:hypothetical protein